MSRSVQPTNYRRDPLPLSEVLAETFRHTGQPEDLTAWADEQGRSDQPLLFCDDQIPRQMELELDDNEGEWICEHTRPELFCSEVNSEFTSAARPGAYWGTWDMPCT